MTRPLYQALASKIVARQNCAGGKNPEWFDRHREDAEKLVRDHLPSGSGFDNGTTIDWDRCTAERLVFKTAFHHMGDHGGYIGWSEHTVVVRPSLCFGFTLNVTGRDWRQIKDYIAEAFEIALRVDERLEPVHA